MGRITVVIFIDIATSSFAHTGEFTSEAAGLLVGSNPYFKCRNFCNTKGACIISNVSNRRCYPKACTAEPGGFYAVCRKCCDAKGERVYD